VNVRIVVNGSGEILRAANCADLRITTCEVREVDGERRKQMPRCARDDIFLVVARVGRSEVRPIHRHCYALRASREHEACGAGKPHAANVREAGVTEPRGVLGFAVAAAAARADQHIQREESGETRGGFV